MGLPPGQRSLFLAPLSAATRTCRPVSPDPARAAMCMRVARGVWRHSSGRGRGRSRPLLRLCRAAGARSGSPSWHGIAGWTPRAISCRSLRTPAPRRCPTAVSCGPAVRAGPRSHWLSPKPAGEPTLPVRQGAFGQLPDGCGCRATLCAPVTTTGRTNASNRLR
jgi:hypothetical protein